MRLNLELMGAPQLQLDHVPVAASRRAVVALLAFLAVNDIDHPHQRHTRESLGALLWTDYNPAKALTNLRHTLWEVTRFIGDGWIVAEHESIYFNPQADIVLDVAQFRSLFSQAAQQPEPSLCIPLLEAATRLYRDDFLTGFTLKEASNFNEWAGREAEKLRYTFMSLLNRLVRGYSTLQEAAAAIPHAQRLIALDSLNESAHRQLMQLYAQTNQHTAAIQQYQTLEKLLRKELNLDPQAETRELYRKIRKGEFKRSTLESRNIPFEKTAPRHNLPVHLTTFIGREKECDEIGRLLAQNRFVTLIGNGGIGKTRLALQVAQSLLDRYPDGIWFVSLDALTDEDLVPQTAADILGIAGVSGESWTTTLLHALRSKTLLLILDSCEHLQNACAQLVETLLKNCPNLTILATSREALRIQGEAFFLVPSLNIPMPTETHSLDSALEYEALRLFSERARLVLPRFEIMGENLPVLIAICNYLDGIPLAIELAAARVDIFKMEEILQELKRSFDLLVSSKRSVLPRHQTMRACIDWGWNLLTDSEQSFLRRLSVFAGGWTLFAAQTISECESMELTRALVQKSFIIVNQESHLETRYSFHDMVRQYVQEKLIEGGEEGTIRERHLKYFLELCWKLQPELHEADSHFWLERLFVERDNIRAALQWAAQTDINAGLYLSGRLRTLWENCDLREENYWLLMV